jgi:hypothetical protein
VHESDDKEPENQFFNEFQVEETAASNSSEHIAEIKTLSQKCGKRTL